MWTFSDLSDAELRAYALQYCGCKSSKETGTRSGYTCPRHRALAELDKRAGRVGKRWAT